MAFKQFKTGENVIVERGQLKGTKGTVIAWNPMDGQVEIDVDGVSVFAANGTVQVVDKAKKAYNPATGTTELKAEVTPKGKQFSKPTTEPIAEPVVEPKSMVEMVEASEFAIPVTTAELKEADEAKPKPAKKESKPCQCLCGEMASPGRMFVSGHDQRHKGNLIRAMQGGNEEAEAELRKRAWRTPAQIEELKGVNIGGSLEEEMAALEELA